MTTRNSRITLVVAGSMLGVLVGMLVAGPTLSQAAEDNRPSTSQTQVMLDPSELFRDPLPAEVVPLPPYPVNALGMTYGSGMNIDEKNPGPDLVAAFASNGAFGYVYAADRPQPADTLVTDPSAESRDSTIPVYAADGKTVVGEFNITGGAVNEFTEATR